MFGGFTNGTNGFNDLWKFDPVAKQWAWISGAVGAASTPGNYGTKGVAAASNVPVHAGSPQLGAIPMGIFTSSADKGSTLQALGRLVTSGSSRSIPPPTPEIRPRLP